MTGTTMLPNSSHLPSSEFLARGYWTISTPYFSLKAKKNSLPQNRIGVIISVAAIKSAARRNFWKRQIKSILADRRGQGLDFLVILFKRADALTKAEFKRELLAAHSRASS